MDFSYASESSLLPHSRRRCWTTQQLPHLRRRRCRTPDWGLSYGTWRKLRRDLVTSKQRHLVVTQYMTEAKLDPTVTADRVKFAKGLSVTFPGQTITTMRGAGKALDYQGINL